eukprot:TRINITY_DN11568_c0_g1_i1.p1 TRINITY_DN11568_c0_g1~~TRINITY_DN11568_c0_g1_i1.p1  ORF type:complete len:209 (-),score=55.39 TRINITY_DN11568_c0_g1_i1:62-688(-)
MNNLILVALVAICLVAVTQAAPAPSPLNCSLLGTWERNATVNKETTLYRMVFTADGEFSETITYPAVNGTNSTGCSATVEGTYDLAKGQNATTSPTKATADFNKGDQMLNPGLCTYSNATSDVFSFNWANSACTKLDIAATSLGKVAVAFTFSSDSTNLSTTSSSSDGHSWKFYAVVIGVVVGLIVLVAAGIAGFIAYRRRQEYEAMI